jgi:4-nitrophenyl phosphatase
VKRGTPTGCHEDDAIAATITGVTRPTSADDPISTVLCDLDGVVWLAHRPIPGSPEAVAALRASGRRVIFVTNNSVATRSQHEAALAMVGIPAEGDVASSSMAAAFLVRPGERVLVCGGPGVVEAFADRGAEVLLNDGRQTSGSFDAVVVGLHRDFDYARLDVAAAAVRAGARLIGTNSDSTFPTPEGLRPGGGAILAAVATASGAVPVIGGKPHQPMADVLAAIVGSAEHPFEPATTLMIGDRLETDGLFAQRLGCRFALVRTGVTAAGTTLDDVGPTVAIDATDLAGVTEQLVPGFRWPL